MYKYRCQIAKLHCMVRRMETSNEPTVYFHRLMEDESPLNCFNLKVGRAEVLLMTMLNASVYH